MGTATALAAVAILALGSLVVLRSRRSLASILFFFLTVLAAGWLIAFALMYSSRLPEIALVWARIGHLMAALIPAAVFQFSAQTVGRSRRLAALSGLFWALCATIGIISATTSLIIPDVRSYAWGYYPSAASFHGVIVGTFAAIMLASIILFWRVWRTSEGVARERAGSLMQAFVLLSLGLIDYLPSIGYNLQPVGYMTTLVFVIVASTAIWRYQLVDLTPEVAAAQILSTMKGAVLVADLDGKVRVANRAARALLGYSGDEIVGLHIRDIMDSDEKYSTAKLLTSSGVAEQQMAWRSRDGTRIDVLASSSFVRDNRRQPVAVVYVASDYTERKRSEAALRESEHRYRSLFDANPLPMWVYDVDTLEFVAVNDAALRHYGYTRAEFLALRITDIRPPEDVPKILEMLPTLPGKSMPHVMRHMKKDGDIFRAEVVSFELLPTERKTRLVIAQDVTERTRAEELLRASGSAIESCSRTPRTSSTRTTCRGGTRR
jgi:PAS domain S-box-containing protein